MWKKIVIEDNLFMIRKSFNDGKHEIIISNFYKVWLESLTEDQLLSRCKEMNPLHEASADVLIERIFELIDSENLDVGMNLLDARSQLTLNLSSYLNGVIFKFRFILQLGTPEMFCQLMTFPLIQMVEELQDQQSTLFDLLSKKDIEINEYKMEGAKLTRRNIETKPFEEKTFLETCTKDASNKNKKSTECVATFFVENCNKLYEKCTKTKPNVEKALSPKKYVPKEKTEEDVEEDVSSAVEAKPTKPKRVKGLVYEDTQDLEDDSETHFSIPEPEVRERRREAKGSPLKKKRTKISQMF